VELERGRFHRTRIVSTCVLSGIGILLSVVPGLAGEAWTQWGGPDRDFTIASTGLATSWPEAGPPDLWTRDFGIGYSGLLFENGRLYTIYRDGDDEVVTALDAADGRTLWEQRYAAKHYENQTQQFGGGPNATPLIVGDRLITVGFTSLLHGLDKASGKIVWSHDLVADFGAKKQDFGYAASPLFHEGNVIVLVGGEKHGALGFDPKDGKVTWKTEPFEISYASPMIIEVGGQEQMVLMSPTEVLGVAVATGKISWRHPHENQYKNNCAGPWWGDDDLLFVSSQGDAGSRTLKLSQSEGATTVEEIARNPKMKVFHNTAMRVGDWIYAGSHDFIAAHNVRTGETAWKERGFSEVNMLSADGTMILLDENGKLALAEVSPKGLDIKASAQVLEKPSWTPPTLVGTRLFVRGKGRLMALDLGEPASR
jgi:outer membrane protein assembly factor BamB